MNEKNQTRFDSSKIRIAKYIAIILSCLYIGDNIAIYVSNHKKEALYEEQTQLQEALTVLKASNLSSADQLANWKELTLQNVALDTLRVQTPFATIFNCSSNESQFLKNDKSLGHEVDANIGDCLMIQISFLNKKYPINSAFVGTIAKKMENLHAIVFYFTLMNGNQVLKGDSVKIYTKEPCNAFIRKDKYGVFTIDSKIQLFDPSKMISDTGVYIGEISKYSKGQLTWYLSVQPDK
jgi:hypothetical protein